MTPLHNYKEGQVSHRLANRGLNEYDKNVNHREKHVPYRPVPTVCSLPSGSRRLFPTVCSLPSRSNRLFHTVCFPPSISHRLFPTVRFQPSVPYSLFPAVCVPLSVS